MATVTLAHESGILNTSNKVSIGLKDTVNQDFCFRASNETFYFGCIARK